MQKRYWAVAVLLFSSRAVAGPSPADSWNAAAVEAYRTGDYTRAEVLYWCAIEASTGQRGTGLAIAENNLAVLYNTQARYAEAEPLLRSALALISKAEGPESAEAGKFWGSLAEVLRNEGRFSDSLSAAEKSASLAAGQRPKDWLTLCRALNNAGAALQALNRNAEAESHFRRALEIASSEFGPEHSLAATAANNLSAVLIATGRYAEAEPPARRAVEAWTKTRGPRDPHTAAAINNLAQSERFQGRYADAEQHYRQAIDIWESVLGPKHPDFASGLCNLADLYRQRGRAYGAELLYRRAVDILDAALGPAHPRTRAAAANLADTLTIMGRRTEADRVRAALSAILPDRP